MSLLLDVLRRAEESRLPSQPAAPHPPTPGPRIELEPLPDTASRKSPPPDMDATQPVAPAPQPVAANHATDTPALPAPPTRRNAPGWLPAGAIALAAGLASAAWLWLAPASTPLAQAHASPVAPSSPETGASPGFDFAASPPQPVAETSPPTPAREVTPPPPPADAPVRFRPTPAAPAAAPFHTGRAHDAYTAGDQPAARTLYRLALAATPTDIDALDGLGAIALQEGRTADAADLFQRALLLNPRDPTALAGLARAHAPDPLQTESRLRGSLAEQPEALALRLALADTLARQQRWAEARHAYLEAHRRAPDNPDIAYNLAVSLDHLGQHSPAASLYRQALKLAERHPARFPRAHCENRLLALLPPEPAP